jgi:hypothetical protein
MTLAEMVAEKVREMDEAAYHALSSAGPTTCGIGEEMPCRHDRCISLAASNAAYWTQLAARCAITLESLVESASSPPRGFTPLDEGKAIGSASHSSSSFSTLQARERTTPTETTND